MDGHLVPPVPIQRSVALSTRGDRSRHRLCRIGECVLHDWCLHPGGWGDDRRLGYKDARLETAKGCHKVLDLAGRRGSAGFEVAFNA